MKSRVASIIAMGNTSNEAMVGRAFHTREQLGQGILHLWIEMGSAF